MKRNLFIFICVFILASFLKTTVAAETELASKLKELGMFAGVGENKDGTTNFDLDRAPTRAEALVMLVRALGKDNVVATYPKTHPFKDVPAWADRYVSYAYDKGLTSGVSSTRFGGDASVSEEMYITFLLRALGYTDGDGKDFYWDSPWALATWCGIPALQGKSTPFLRNDVVNFTCAALYANLKGTQRPLYEHLISEHCFTEQQFRKAFPANPFSDFRLIDAQVSEFIRVHEHLGMIKNNTFALETHIITDMKEEGNVLNVSTLVSLGTVTVDKDNAIVGSSWSTEMWLIALDRETFEYRSGLRAVDISNQGGQLQDYFSEETLDAQTLLMKGQNGVAKLVIQSEIDNGQLQYTPPTYEESLERMSSGSSFHISKRIETKPCTILLGEDTGTPHGGNTSLCLIYKEGSAVGAGEVISLPLPMINPWGITAAPEELRLSADGLTLFYSSHFEDTMIVDGNTIHEAGIYRYTVDLTTGEVALVIDKNL